jgi:hypothetical protein
MNTVSTTPVTKLPPAPSMARREPKPTEEGANAGAVMALVDNQTALLVREIRRGIEILQDTEAEILKEAARLKAGLGAFANVVEHINSDNAERFRNLEKLRADNAALVNSKV